MGDPHKDAALKEFKAPQEKAGVYVYRNEMMGGAIRMDVLIDGIQIGSTAPNTYLYKEVEPGKHTITSKAENSDSVEIDAKPGMIAFVWQEVKMGILYARTKLHLVGDIEGKKGVQETKLAVQ
jgi:hypothetical protein